MSIIPPNTNNSVFEETKIVVREWLLATKNLDIDDNHHSDSVGYCVYSKVQRTVAALKHIRAVHIDDVPLFTHPSYAACVKFALEYERGE